MRNTACSIALVLLLLTATGLSEQAARSPGYPQWRGPDGSGAAVDSESRLVSSWSDAELLWASEPRNPLPHNWASGAVRPHRQVGNGGYSCPIYSEGKIYVAAYEPSGPEAEQLTPKLRRAPDICKRVAAKDVLYCLDAETGQLIWKAAFDKGLNMAGHTHSGHYVPCVSNGRAYWVGTIGRMYCVDAKTGEHLWDAPIDPAAEAAFRYRAYCIENKQMPRSPRRDLQYKRSRQKKQQREKARKEIGLAGSRGWGWDSPVIAAGKDTVVTNTPGGAFVGFDAKTGKKLWHCSGAAGNTRAPAVWEHKGKQYVLGVSRGGLVCIESRSGKVLWKSPLARSGHYGGSTPPISGDILLCQGGDGEDARGWSAVKLTLDGPKRLWMTDRPVRCTYESPVIYNGHVWLAIRNPGRWTRQQQDYMHKLAPEVFTRKLMTRWKEEHSRGAIVVMELETGKFTGAIDGGQLGCSSLIAGDGRIFYSESNSLAMLRADPHNPEHLGNIYPPNLWCVTPVYADGKLLWRGSEYLVNCWDLRENRPVPPQTQSRIDPKNAKIELNLESARLFERGLQMAFKRGHTAESPRGDDLRLHLRTRDGEIVQSWITVGPEHNVPEWTFPQTLKVTDTDITGKLAAWCVSRKYPFQLHATIRNGRAVGRWDDRFEPELKRGVIAGESHPIATGDGTVRLRVRREWCGGQNKNFETTLTFRMKDGKAVPGSAEIVAKNPQITWSADVTSFQATQKGQKLSGSLTCDLTSKDLVKSGTYRLAFETTVRCNQPTGTYRSWYAEREITPWSAVNKRIWGTFAVPKTAKIDPANAMHDFTLRGPIPGQRDLRITVEMRNGKCVSVKGKSPRFSRADHSVDFSEVTLENGTLEGPVEVIVRSDGFRPPHDIKSHYKLTMNVKDPTISGTYEGFYEDRGPRSGT
ncbi:MAG: PQQ-binding-like beta-propeller repeat protein, partial [Phycisphaerae bacterium]